MAEHERNGRAIPIIFTRTLTATFVPGSLKTVRPAPPPNTVKDSIMASAMITASRL